MTDRFESHRVVVHFQDEVARLIGKGFGDDDCDAHVTSLFNGLAWDICGIGQAREFELDVSRTVTYTDLLPRILRLRVIADKVRPDEDSIESDRGRVGVGDRVVSVITSFVSALAAASILFIITTHFAAIMNALLSGPLS